MRASGPAGWYETARGVFRSPLNSVDGCRGDWLVREGSLTDANDHWDLVDRVEKDKNFISEVKESELPAELKGKSKEEVKKAVVQKSAEREKIQKEIEALSIKRQEYIDKEMKKRGNSDADDLGKAIENSVLELAKKNGYSI